MSGIYTLFLLNVEYLVVDAELAVEDLLIGFPVLLHSGLYTKTLLENRRDFIYGRDCAEIKPIGHH